MGRVKQKTKVNRYIALTFTLVVGIGVVEPALNPPAAEAVCFFWQACARQRGRASNTQAGGKRTGRILGGNDASLPYVISPRNSWIRQPAPDQTPYSIRWHAVEGANSYRVRLWRWTFERDRPDIAIWETTVEHANQTPFPDLVLEPGPYYSIEVVTDMGVSSNSDNGYYESGFQLLFEEDYGELRSQLQDVTPAIATDTGTENLSEEAVLARAGVFFLEKMYADALTILQPLAESSTASDLVYTALGDTYSQSGLTQLAIDAYQQALTLAIANGDALSEATTRVNLADVYATLGRFDDSLQQLRQARDIHEQLNNTTEMASLERRIDVLSTRLLRRDEAVPIP